MKIYRKSILWIAILLALFSTEALRGNDPPRPPAQHQQEDDQDPAGGGAPLEGGEIWMLLAGGVYLMIRLSGPKAEKADT